MQQYPYLHVALEKPCYNFCSNLDCNCGALHASLVLWLRLVNSLIRSLFPLEMHDWIVALQ